MATTEIIPHGAAEGKDPAQSAGVSRVDFTQLRSRLTLAQANKIIEAAPLPLRPPARVSRDGDGCGSRRRPAIYRAARSARTEPACFVSTLPRARPGPRWEWGASSRGAERGGRGTTPCSMGRSRPRAQGKFFWAQTRRDSHQERGPKSSAAVGRERRQRAMRMRSICMAGRRGRPGLTLHPEPHSTPDPGPISGSQRAAKAPRTNGNFALEPGGRSESQPSHLPPAAWPAESQWVGLNSTWPKGSGKRAGPAPWH